MVRLADRPDMTLDVYRRRKTMTQHNMTDTLISKAYVVHVYVELTAINFYNAYSPGIRLPRSLALLFLIFIQ